MEKFISQNNLESFYKKEIQKSRKKEVNDRLEKRRAEGQSNPGTKKIFLSHSHLDKTVVNKIGLLFDNLNAPVYVDWLDKSLPLQTNKQTAVAIKSKIQNSSYFLFLATYHGLRSKWCNWELGIADSIKGENKLAILPIETRTGKWAGNEYLHLYPEMKFETDDLEKLSANQISIKMLSGDTVPFQNWLEF